MSDIIFVPSYSIRPNSICLYNQIEGSFTSSHRTPTNNQHSQLGLSYKQAIRIQKVCSWLYYVSKVKKVYQLSTNSYFSFRLSFITLTLSSKQVHTDKDILKLVFEPFLRKLRTSHPQLLYLWKAEVQDNGNLHFHLNTNIFVHYRELRILWNTCQAKLKYVTPEEIPNRPSTDIKAVRKDKELGNYLSKYMAKGDKYKKPLLRYFVRYKSDLDKNTFVTHLPTRYFANIKRKLTIKLWDCSLLLKSIRINDQINTTAEHNAIGDITAGKNVFKGDYFEYYSGINFKTMSRNPIKDKLDSKLKSLIAKERMNKSMYTLPI